MLRTYYLSPLLLISLHLLLFSHHIFAAEKVSSNTKIFIKNYCLDCHDSETTKGDLDLTKISFTGATLESRALLVDIHDRILNHEMPPKKKKNQPSNEERQLFISTIAGPIIAAEQAQDKSHGRTTWRRMNRLEYEATVRDLLDAPWLQIKDILPEDGESHRFNKIGESLDVSHVQVAQYLQAAEYALRAVLATKNKPTQEKTIFLRARDVDAMTKKMFFSEFNRSPERATFPVLGTTAQPDVRNKKAPMTNKDHPAIQAQEAIGIAASSYEPIELRFANYTAPQDGFYTVSITGYSLWVGPGDEKKWWRPNLDAVSKGRRPEPITVYGERPPRQIRRLGAFDVGIDPTTKTLEVYLLEGETIRVDAARLFRSRPPGSWHNPLATKEGQPGVAFKSLEVTGPHMTSWPSKGHKLLFGDLPFTINNEKEFQVQPQQPLVDAEHLLRQFLHKAYRRPVMEPDVQRFMAVVKKVMEDGNTFADAMIAGYAAILCSPSFVCLEERPGILDNYALASRLSYFIWNSGPDEELRTLAASGKLQNPDILRQQSKRLLADQRSDRFIESFLDYWLDLRKIDNTTPDAELYNDYYLDDLLVESSILETQAFFHTLVAENLPAKSIINTDFVMINERLADLYNIPNVAGVEIRRVPVPKNNPRGGLMTQASVLKVTANGTTTSPVLRGAWIMERILGKAPPPPPPSVPAIEPDTRGATTIREQLEKHRTDPNCASCHAKIDPAGFALESFDVLGGWRDRYRGIGDKGEKVQGYGKNGQPFAFHLGAKVDPSGELPDGRKFADIRELKHLFLDDERQIARNIAQQLTIYATGAGIRFADRPQIEKMLDQAAVSHFGITDIIHAIVQSELFRNK